jgi:hypothetical protein
VDFSHKESRQARIERTLGGTGALFRVGRLLATVKNGKTLAQHLAEGEEIGRDVLDFPYPLHEQFRLSLPAISLWGCPFCGTAHGSGVGVSRSVNVASLESNQFYYNPLTQQLFTISATCLKKQPGLAERLTDLPAQATVESSAPIHDHQVIPAADHQMVNDNYPRLGQKSKRSSQQESYWVRKSIAFMVACYCSLVIYSRSLVRGKNS